MKNIGPGIPTAFTAFGGVVGWFLGGFDGFLYALIAFVVIDYVSGIMVAISNKTLSSRVGFTGIFKKVLIFLLVGVGNILDVYILGDAGVLRSAVIFFYLSNEGISILENTATLGMPYPKKLMEILEQIKEEEKDEENSNGTEETDSH